MVELNTFLERLRLTVVEVSVSEAYQKQLRGGILVDIREKDEVNSGSPVAALRIPKGMLEMQVKLNIPESDTEIYLVCGSGKRSLIAAFCLQQMGYNKVYSVQGGFTAWKNHSLPFEMPQVLKEADLERYKRHILIPEIGEKGQLKLLKSKVLIVGAGGIGSSVAFYLAAAGVGYIGIIDDDIVDSSNLQRQILHTEKSVGNYKVDSAKERLQALNSGIHITTIHKRLNAGNIESIIDAYDMVLDGTDNFMTRYLINDACVKLQKPNVHGSVFRFEGQVSTFWPSSGIKNAPCYRCLYPSPPPPDLSPSCAEAGVLGVLPGMVGILCATEAIKILAEFGNTMIGKLLCFNALTWDFDTYDIEKNNECPYCDCKDTSKYPAYSDYAETCTI